MNKLDLLKKQRKELEEAYLKAQGHKHLKVMLRLSHKLKKTAKAIKNEEKKKIRAL